MSRSDVAGLSKLCSEAFLAAYLVTGCQFASEHIVYCAIDELEPERVDSCELLAGTVRLAVGFARAQSEVLRPGSETLKLPDDLERVMQLRPILRYSFVARVLLGFSLGDCVKLLQEDAITITSALIRATCQLNKARTRSKTPTDQIAAAQFRQLSRTELHTAP